MKKPLNLLWTFTLFTAMTCQAGLVSFGLSPAGSDASPGLSPANVVPAASSTGSGGTISGGIVFNTDTHILQLAFGYGSAAGFTDLTSPASRITLNGPAATNQNAAVLYNLMRLNFTATDPASGGVVFGSLVVSSNAVADLLSGMDYISIATTNNPDGELRGQLVPVSPILSCPDYALIECGSPYTNALTVSDPQGLAMNVYWVVNGHTVQTNSIAAGTPGTTYSRALNEELPMGTNLVEVLVIDSANNSASCSTKVVVVDTTPPVIVSASATPNVLWPPDHKMVTVTVSANVTDNCGTTSWRIIGVQSSEPVNIIGSGNTAPDWQILSDHSVALRAERSGTGSGRIYTITIQATDEAGNLSNPWNVTVQVPKSQGRGWRAWAQ